MRSIIVSSVIFYYSLLHPVSAQQTYGSQHYGGPGTQQLYSTHLTGFTNDEIIAHGADTVWNVSNLIATDLILSEIVARDEAMDGFTFLTMCQLSELMGGFACLTIYANTQQAWSMQGSQTILQFELNNLRRFQRKTQTQLLETFLGFTVDLGGAPTTFAVIYNMSDTVLTFPMMYDDSLSSRISWSINLAAIGQNVQYHSHQHRTTKVDGWGTLITPYDTLRGVLRVRSVIAHQDTIVTDTLTLPVMLNQVEYTWYDTSYGVPVMIANGIIVDSIDNIGSVSYLVEAICVAPDWTVSTDASVYFIDDTGSATVEFYPDSLNADIFTWDFGDGLTETSTGNISHVYLSPGEYTITVTGCLTNCLPLNTCTMQTVSIEVIDTTSAVFWSNPEGDGIRIYPNPSNTNITLDIPMSIGVSAYQVLDMHGKSVLNGNANPGLNNVTITQIPSGLYLIQLRDPISGTLYRAVRVLILNSVD